MFTQKSLPGKMLERCRMKVIKLSYCDIVAITTLTAGRFAASYQASANLFLYRPLVFG